MRDAGRNNLFVFFFNFSVKMEHIIILVAALSQSHPFSSVYPELSFCHVSP